MGELLSPHSSTYSPHTQMSQESGGRTGKGCDDTTSLARTTLDKLVTENDDKEDDIGRQQQDSATRPTYATLWDSVTAGQIGDTSTGRQNEEGWRYWDSVVATIGVSTDVQEKLKDERDITTQRIHCAALARFCRVGRHLKQSIDTINTFEQLITIVCAVLSWSDDNGAKLFWIRAMRTALSVLFDYKFSKKLSDNSIIKAILRVCTIRQLPVKKPLELTWELPTLLDYIKELPINGKLEYTCLQAKCIVLIMIGSAARFSEIIQFRTDESNPENNGKRWKFIVKVKGKLFKQPIAIHTTTNPKLDPVKAMVDLRKKMKSKRWSLRSRSGTFWRNNDGSEMKAEHLRKRVQLLLTAAGISDTPCHVKHATITWLHRQRVPPDRIVQFMRHAQSSTTYVDYYLNEDLGKACTVTIDTSAATKRQRQPKAA
jgi:integrase